MATHQRVPWGRDAKVPAHAPDWTTWNDHDPGVTLLVLFGFVATGLLWESSGRRQRAGSTPYRMLGVGLGTESAYLYQLTERLTSTLEHYHFKERP